MTAHFYYKPDLAPILQDVYGVSTLEQVDGILEERQANLVRLLTASARRILG